MPHKPDPKTTGIPMPARSVLSSVDGSPSRQRDSAPSQRVVPDHDASDVVEMDPALCKLVEGITRRIHAGELVEMDELAAEYPSWAATLRQLLPAVRGLAELGKAVDNDGLGSRRDEPTAKDRPVFGDFRIVREIGRGGMGIVYEAEQVALGRRVALKILPLAVAMDPRSLQRFQLEAQVAGWLQHPRIVPVHAVGQFNDVPYYAMQFIEGGSLADLIAELRGIVDRGLNVGIRSRLNGLAGDLLSGRFARTLRPSGTSAHPADGSSGTDRSPPVDPSIRTQVYLRTVARLGIQAAEALGYAHEQGIIHRDIKPANLLLDQRGDLWVADFGMADVQGGAGLTLTGDLPGTLRYMSPEQAAGRRALVDRRTDIYSLGATLYELLTLQSAIAGDDRQEIFRRIAEEEPLAIRRVNSAVPVDLATIVGKALSKDPSNRYETAWHFAADLERFLDGLPIAARRVDRLTRTWRWCRRKPLLAGLAASLGFAVVVGFAGIMWNWRAAVHQKGLLLVAEKEARTQAARADAINHFLIDKLLNQASPENNPAASRVTLLEVLDRAAAEVGSSFSGQPTIEAALRLAIGRTYHGLGEHAKSVAHLRAAFEILDRDAHHQDRLEVMCELGHNLCHLGKLDAAAPLLMGAAEESTRILGARHSTSLLAAEYLAELQSAKGRYADAELTYRSYLDEARRAEKPDQEVLLTAVNNLGIVLLRLGKTNEAEGLYRRLVEDSRRTRGPKHPGTLAVLNNLALLLEKQKKYGEAEQLFRECLKLNREVLGPQHPGTLALRYNLAYVINDQGRFDEAEVLFREHLVSQREVSGPEHPSTLYAISGLGSLLRGRGRLDEAEQLVRPCLDAQQRTLGTDHPDTLKTARLLKAILADRAKLDAAKSSSVAGIPKR
jgi:eukaryotic-like serine/threonine-protein kinase